VRVQIEVKDALEEDTKMKANVVRENKRPNPPFAHTATQRVTRSGSVEYEYLPIAACTSCHLRNKVVIPFSLTSKTLLMKIFKVDMPTMLGLPIFDDHACHVVRVLYSSSYRSEHMQIIGPIALRHAPLHAWKHLIPCHR
jgi:hypothetical protein